MSRPQRPTRRLRFLRDIDFRGLAIPDHFPTLDGDPEGRASLAYAIGCLRGMLAGGGRGGSQT
jgi:hypothetical protein